MHSVEVLKVKFSVTLTASLYRRYSQDNLSNNGMTRYAFLQGGELFSLSYELQKQLVKYPTSNTDLFLPSPQMASIPEKSCFWRTGVCVMGGFSGTVKQLI